MDDLTWCIWFHNFLGIMSVIGGVVLVLWGWHLADIYYERRSRRAWEPFAGVFLIVLGIVLELSSFIHFQDAHLARLLNRPFP